MNTKEQQRSQEEAEAKQARLRYDVVSASVAELAQQLTEQQTQLTTYATADADYDRFIQEKRIALRFSAGYVGSQYQQRLYGLICPVMHPFGRSDRTGARKSVST